MTPFVANPAEPDRGLRVPGEEASFRRLLLTLVDNAVKSTPSGGTVAVTGSRDGAHAFLPVADTGVGIAQDDQPHFFERFWRADTMRSRDAAGIGLGLSIARQTADEHGASLSVESEVGRGSLFAARLPLADR